MYFNTIRANGERQKQLIGKFYKCIFDEKKKKYTGKKHCHEILDVYIINAQGYIYNGLALNLKGLVGFRNTGLVMGCREEDIENTRKLNDNT